MELINIWRHLKKICVHKYWVARYCFKAGLYWQGITHDLSKFSPTEFIESVKYYQGTRSPIAACKEENGYSKAWLHHRGRNLHHYQCWTDDFDNNHTDKGITLIEMPYKYALEMLCDYLGAARAYLGKDFTYSKEWGWWVSKRDNSAMNPHTKHFIDACLHNMAVLENCDILSCEPQLRAIYEFRGTDFFPEVLN